MRPTRPALFALGLALALALPLPAQQDYAYTLLDDFEDPSAWIKGDPTTDMEQREVGYVPSTRLVKQGQRSLAFMIRVDWSDKPGQQYAKGWPMLSRTFDAPQDWSAYDRLEFWVYTETEAALPDRALRCGLGTPEGKPGEWHDIALTRNDWTHVSLLLSDDQDWTRVTGVWFYIAEAWYSDGDRINFYLDDLRLARRLSPHFLDCSITARTNPRGQAADAHVAVEGPVEGLRLRTRFRKGDEVEATTQTPLAAKRGAAGLSLVGVSGGGHLVDLDLLGRDGEVRDSTTQYLRVPEPGRRTYLNLITFYTPHLLAATAEQMAVINDTPYDGVAMGVVGGYDTDPVPDYATYAAQVAMLKRTCRYHVWPWVFSNRFIGRAEDGSTHPSVGGQGPEYFRRIKCLDLDDAAGARSDMLKLWRNAVRLARDLRAPGIVLDLEAYNNYRAYDLAYVAERRGDTIGQVARACEAVGADLARLVQEEYPECIVWSLFSRLRPTGLTAPDYDGPLYQTPGHISLGFLRYCRDHAVPARYLCGGELEVGYYNATVEALKARIRARDAAYAAPLQAFPDHFFLAGTISPYHDYTILTSWIGNQAGDDPELRTIEDFRPMFKTLFDAYDWVWIYASSAAKTLPYSPENARLYGDVLRGALDDASK